MKIKLNSYKLLFRLLDILSNSRWLHKMVINKKIYLGATIISLSMANSGCSSSKMNTKVDTQKKDQADSVANNEKNEYIYIDSVRVSIDTNIKHIGTCYATVQTIELTENSINAQKNPFLLNTIDPTGENISLINNYASNAVRPKETEKISGNVYLEFVIKKDGQITNVRIQRGLHPLLDEIATKAIRNLRIWSFPENYIPQSDIDFVIPIKFY